MVTSDNKTRIVSVVNIFETGSADGNYADISIFRDGKKDDSGERTRQITYGRSQTTEQGNLKDLINDYINNNGQFADAFKPYLPKIGVEPLVEDDTFKSLLKQAATEDPIMKTTQDAFFDKVYYAPATKFFTDNGFTYPLSMLVIYDSYVHSGCIPDWLRSKFREVPPVKGGDEKEWIKAYTTARQNWLEGKSSPLNKTVYRTQTILKAIAENNWNLDTEIISQGVRSRDIDAPQAIEITPIRISRTWFMTE